MSTGCYLWAPHLQEPQIGPHTRSQSELEQGVGGAADLEPQRPHRVCKSTAVRSLNCTFGFHQ